MANSQFRQFAFVLSAAFLGAAAQPALAEPLHSLWAEGFNNRARLVAARVTTDGAEKTYAAVEIEMPHDWKTYWRTVGEAGGIPPEFDWSGSENLASAVVHYPAPRRLHDKSGDVVGYKNRAIFPVEITPKDPALPIKLKGTVHYGVCKELCVPAEVALDLEIPPVVGANEAVSKAVHQIPRAVRAGIDPSLTAWRVDQSSGKPKLILDVASGTPDDADAFVDIADGTFVPLPKRISAASGAATFEVDLTDGVAIKDLTGKPLRVTLVDSRGQSETIITLQ